MPSLPDIDESHQEVKVHEGIICMEVGRGEVSAAVHLGLNTHARWRW